MITIDEIIKEIDGRACGRTRYEGQEPRWDEMMVAEIRQLREAVRVLAWNIVEPPSATDSPFPTAHGTARVKNTVRKLKPATDTQRLTRKAIERLEE